MCPDLQGTAGQRRKAGKVFALVTDPPRGLCPARPRLEVDRAAWDECVRCPDFDHCYKLSMAKLAMQIGAHSL
jgi:hypothetical protein